MAVLVNNTEALIHGPRAPEMGMPAQCWLPGKNPLDPKYWSEVKGNFMLRKMLKAKAKGKDKPMLQVDLKASMPDPLKPPTLEELVENAEDFEVQEMLDDKSTPETWRYTLTQALTMLKGRKASEKAERDAARLAERMKEDGPLKDMPVRLAVPKVEAETSLDTLVKWYEDDDRKTVKEAIDRRVAELEDLREKDKKTDPPAGEGEGSGDGEGTSEAE